MPYKSKAQRRKFWAMVDRGELPESTAREWERETKNKEDLPEKVMEKKSYNAKPLIAALGGGLGGAAAGAGTGIPIGAIMGALDADEGQRLQRALRGAMYGGLGGAAVGGMGGSLIASGGPLQLSALDKAILNASGPIGAAGNTYLGLQQDRDRDADNDGISSEGTPREKRSSHRVASSAHTLGAQYANHKLGLA